MKGFLTGSTFRHERTASVAGPDAGASGVFLVVLLALSACGRGTPSDVGEGRVPVVAVLGGDAQFAEPGTQLPRPFEVLVRKHSDLKPKENVRVEWTIREGSGGSLSRATTFTDAAGRASTTLTLGPAPEAFVVRATFPDDGPDPVDFRARAVLRPELSSISPDPVAPGSEVTLEGSQFVPEIDQIVVLFGGIRGQVVAGGPSILQVRVPDCLDEVRVPVTVSLGPIRSDTLEVELDGSGNATHLLPGQALRTDDPEALSCTLLEGGTDRSYLAVVHSSSTVGAAAYGYGLVLRGPASTVTAPPPVGEETLFQAPESSLRSVGRAQVEWDTRVRRLEKDAVERTPPRDRPSRAPSAPAAVPSPGDRRSFEVLNGDGKLEPVSAEVRYVGRHSVIYVDLAAPPGGFTDADLETLGDEFDDPIHPTVTQVYGEESDLDGNGRVVILFTPVVNRLTDGDGHGFVGGFFYGADLLPDRPGSNDGEIFYAVVPDPDGTEGPPRTRGEVLSNVPAVLAHEFTHMVHFNQRVLLRGAPTTEALWLSEALAVTSEELVGDVFAARGETEKARTYRDGNHQRARLFLADPSGTSLVVTSGSGTLEERGAGWLFLEYLRGLRGNDVLGELVQTIRTGTENVTAVVDRPWAELVEAWSAALYLDGLGIPVDDRYSFGGFDIRSTLSVSGTFALRPPVWTGGAGSVVADLPSSSASFVLLDPKGAAGVAVNLAGPDGGALPSGSKLGLTLVRLR